MAQYIEGDDWNQSMLLSAAIDNYVSPASPVRNALRALFAN